MQNNYSLMVNLKNSIKLVLEIKISREKVRFNCHTKSLLKNNNSHTKISLYKKITNKNACTKYKQSDYTKSLYKIK